MKTLVTFPTVFEAKKIFRLYSKFASSSGGNIALKKRSIAVGDFFEVRVADIFQNLPAQNLNDTFVFFISGIGCEISAISLADCALKFNPDEILLAGFAGACNPDLKIGDFIFDAENEAVVSAAKKIGAKEANIFSSREIADEAAKISLFKNHNVDAVEMESELFKSALAKEEIAAPFSQIRCVSDNTETDAPLSKLGFSTDYSNGAMQFSLIVFILAVLKNPALILKFFKFAKNAANAQKIYDVKIVDFLKLFAARIK